MRILFCGSGWLPFVDVLRGRLPVAVTVDVRDAQRPLVEQVGNYEVLMPSNARVDAAVIAAASRLRLIQQPAVGYEGIDLPAARARNVPVCNAPGVNQQAVAEAALLLMLALARRLPASRRAFAERTIGAPLGTELHGKTLGLIGMGRSGARLAAAAAGLGMKVMSVRSSSARRDLDELLARSDVVSLHCPLTPQTRNLIDAFALARMKPGAFLINCARGAIVDKTALEAALQAGRLGGAGLDVFWDEPWDPGDPLFQREDVVVLPHLGGSTREAFARLADLVAENVRRVGAKEPLLNRVA